MGEYCKICKQKNEYQQYEVCKKCYEERQKGTILLDTNKMITIPIWTIITLFILGIIIGLLI